MVLRKDGCSTRENFKKHMKTDVVNSISKNHMNETAAKKLINEMVYKRGRSYGYSIDECLGISEDIFNAMYRLDVLQPYIDDEQVNEIMVNGPNTIIIEKNGKIFYTDDYFETEEILMNVIQSIVSKVNRRVNQSTPIVDARLEDGSRIHIVLPPVALNGPILTIRKFKNSGMSLDYMVKHLGMKQDFSEFLKKLIVSKYNIFISGGTSSGKTTFLNALSEHIPSEERVITIEDAAELSLKTLNLVTLETKPPNVEGEGAITMDMLIKASLRMRPDRIVVGEVRGKEALDMLTAMNTGHDGSLSTGHANSCVDMLKRLEIMILKAIELPQSVLIKTIGSSIDIMIHLERTLEGKRQVIEVVELLPSTDQYQLNTLYKRDDKELIKINDMINTFKLERDSQ